MPKPLLRLTLLSSAVFCVLPPQLAQAQENLPFRLSGFGTLGVAHFSRDDIDFVNGPQRRGVGASEAVSAAIDSKFGLQAAMSLFENLEVTGLALAKQTARGNFTPSIEAANLKYSFTDGVAIRAGRISHPFFMVSDYRQVDYVNLMLRSPVEVYGLVPLTASDVLEGIVKFGAGSGMLTLEGGVGRANGEVAASDRGLRNHDTAKVENMAFVNATYERGPLVVRVGHTEGKFTYDNIAARAAVFEPLSTALAGVGGSGIRKQWEIDGVRSSFTGIGAVYDSEKIVLSGEYVMLRSGKAFNDSDAMAFHAGYHMGKFTPYIGYAVNRTRNRLVVANVANTLVSNGLDATTAGEVQAGIQALADGSVQDQKTVSIGARWDVARNIALKAQFDHISVKDPSARGFLSNPTSQYPGGAGGNLFSLAMNFIF